MGYDLHITRAENWEDNLGLKIPVSEWIDLVDEDSELDSDDASGPYSVNWLADDGAVRAWFDWSDGAIYTTNPDREALGKLLQMAASLRARVQGDDGEEFRSLDDWRSFDE